MELTNRGLEFLKDYIDNTSDSLRHYPDGSDMGWSEDDIEAFYDLVTRHRAAAKAAGFWWARY